MAREDLSRAQRRAGYAPAPAANRGAARAPHHQAGFKFSASPACAEPSFLFPPKMCPFYSLASKLSNPHCACPAMTCLPPTANFLLAHPQFHVIQVHRGAASETVVLHAKMHLDPLPRVGQQVESAPDPGLVGVRPEMAF